MSYNFSRPTVKELLAKGTCPNCMGTLDAKPDYITCRTCGIHGNPREMRWCESVQIFDMIPEGRVVEGKQIFQRGDRYFTLAGTMQGCGRVLLGDWCENCREYPPPKPAEHAVRRSGGRPARARVDAKTAAAGGDA